MKGARAGGRVSNGGKIGGSLTLKSTSLRFDSLLPRDDDDDNDDDDDVEDGTEQSEEAREDNEGGGVDSKEVSARGSGEEEDMEPQEDAECWTASLAGQRHSRKRAGSSSRVMTPSRRRLESSSISDMAVSLPALMVNCLLHPFILPRNKLPAKER